MKEKIIAIFEKYFPTGYTHDFIHRSFIPDIVDEILKIAEFEALCNPNIYEASANEHFEQQIAEKEKTVSDLTDAEITAEAKQYAVHHSAAPDKDCPTWIIADFEAGAKWARMKTIGVIQDSGGKTVSDEEIEDKSISIDQYLNMNPNIDPNEFDNQLNDTSGE